MSSTRSPYFELIPQISVVSISSLNLPIAGTQVDYGSQGLGLPTFNLALGRTLMQWGPVGFHAEASIGYGSRSGLHNVVSDTLVIPRSDDISLKLLPLMLTVRLSYRFQTFAWLRPSIGISGGTLGVVQSSLSNPGLNRSAGLPLLVISPQVSFLDLTAYKWLGGFSFGASFVRGLGNETNLTASSLDLRLNFLL